MRARYCSVPDERLRVDRLRTFVRQSAQLAPKYNLQGVHAYTAKFLQFANDVSTDYLTAHGKRTASARQAGAAGAGTAPGER